MVKRGDDDCSNKITNLLIMDITNYYVNIL